MIRAGRLSRTVTLEERTVTVSPAGTRTEAWAPVATVRAERVEPTVKEALADHGERATARVGYRMRRLEGVTVALRLVDDGVAFNVREVREVGRRELVLIVERQS